MSRLLACLNPADDIEIETFRAYMRDELAPTLGRDERVVKTRINLLEPLGRPEPDAEIDKNLAVDERYAVTLEVAFRNRLELRAFFGSQLYRRLSPSLVRHCGRMNVFHASAYLRYVENGERTMVGRLGGHRAQLVRDVGANHIARETTWL